MEYEEVEFSAEELAHFDAVFEAIGQSKDADQKMKKSPSGKGDRMGDTVPDRNLTDGTIEEARGRPRKNPEEKDEPTHSGRDPKQHIQVIAGQAAAGRNIEFNHNDGSTSTITPEKGRKIVAHLNSLKPAERHSAVNKMHDSSKGMI